MTTSIRSKALAAAVTLAAASAANATPFMINNGVDFGPNGSTSTSSIKELGYTGTTATSIYLGNPALVGTTVIDTNIASVMNSYGFSAGNKTAIDGITNLSFGYPAFPDTLNIDAVNNAPSIVADKNGFVSGAEPVPYGTVLAGGSTWGLSYQYKLMGTTTATDVQYTGGFLDIFYQTAADGTGAKQVLRLNVTGSEFQGVNLDLHGVMSFDFDGNGTDDADAFVKSFWKDQLSNTTFYQNWLDGDKNVNWTIDTNVNPPLPGANQLWQSATGALIRQSTLDGSLTFQVPEPGSLALLGLALAGMGFVRRQKSGK